jgi:leucyl aminopeptidase (aminopeptidase T)
VPDQVDAPRGFGNVLDRCLAVRPGEQVLLLTDDGTDAEVVAGLIEGIEARRGVPVVSRMPVPVLPGSEPPSTVAAAMRAAGAVIELTSLFIGSSAARREATIAGVRYLAMPGVRLETFRDDGPLAVDFDAIRSEAERIGDAWGSASSFRLTTPAGTDLRGSVQGRPGRVLHGLARDDGDYMAPPELVAIEGAEAGRLEEMLGRCADERMSNLAEVSMAFNPSGRVCGVAMETESSRGTAHIALGNSMAYGGTVDAVAHLDCVMREATLELDGRPVMVAGELV